MPIHGAIFDIFTDLIPGGDVIDNLLGVGGNGGGGMQNLLPGNLNVPAGRRSDVRVSPVGMNNGLPGCQITVQMSTRSVAHCPTGYVAVDTDGDGVTDTCMLKEVAKACKLWRPRPKPLLTASDRKTLSRATRVMGRVDAVVKQTNALRGQARLTKQSRTRRK